MLLTTMAPFCSAMQSDEDSIETLDDVPRYYVDLARRLSEQPVFTGRGNPWGSGYVCRILLSNNYVDCRISEILSDNAQKYLPTAWLIRTFGNYEWCYYKTIFSGNLGHGMDLVIAKDHAICSLDELTVVYQSLVDQLQKGWSFSTLEKNPDIFFKQPEESWLLFIKNDSFLAEEVLIRFLASKFRLDEKIESYGNFARVC